MSLPVPTRQIITELDIAGLKRLQAEMGHHLLIIKFGADWCGPCKRIAPAVYKLLESASPKILFADINVDENLDLYLGLKKSKMIQGIPAFLVYYGNTKRDQWFIPDDSVIGANEEQLVQLFARCETKIDSTVATGYTYYS